MWNVFENAWLLLTIAGITLIIISMLRMDHPEWGRKPLLIPLLLAALGVALDIGFKSDNEYIQYIMTESKTAAENKDVEGMMKYVSSDYSDRAHFNKAALQVAMKYYLENASFEKIKIQSHQITLKSKTTAASNLSAVIHLSGDSQYVAAGNMFYIGMTFEFEKQKHKWYIKNAELASVNNNPMNWGQIP